MRRVQKRKRGIPKSNYYRGRQKSPGRLFCIFRLRKSEFFEGLYHRAISMRVSRLHILRAVRDYRVLINIQDHRIWNTVVPSTQGIECLTNSCLS